MLSFFKSAVFDLSFFRNQKNRIALKSKIKSEIESSGSYFLLLIGSTIIATLELLINNSAVVIGAMIMAPLYGVVSEESYRQRLN